MRYTIALATAIAGTMLTGCAPTVSIHPLYTSQDLSSDLPLEGTWMEEDGGTWQVEKSGDGYVAVVLHKGDSAGTEAYSVHELRLQGRYFLDISSKSDPDLAVPGHLFAKVALEGDELAVNLMADDWLKKMAQAGAAPQFIGGDPEGQIILTAPSGELQRFILANADNAEAWDGDTGRLHRVR